MTSAIGIALALALLAASAGTALAQSYPVKPIRVIASQGPGGLSDVFMRTLAEELRGPLGETVVVENRTGAGGTIGARACGEAPPDGYTICILPGEAMVINPIISPNSGFDPKKQLVPITRLFYLTQVFAVNADLGVKTFAELAALARAKPKTLNYQAPNIGKVAFMEEFNRANGTDIIRVPFKGGGDAVNAMLTGTTPISVIGIGNVMQYVKAGKIVGFAVDSPERSPLAPDIPTFKELGYTRFITAAFFGIYAPAGTPHPIIERLHREIVAASSKPEFLQRNIVNRGLAPVLDSPDHFASALELDRAEGLATVKASGLHPELNKGL